MCRLLAHGGFELRPKRRDDQQSHRRRLIDHLGQEFQGGRIDPVNVLKDHKQRRKAAMRFR